MNYLFYDTLKILIGNKELSGELIIPEKAKSVVLFSHGSGSSRFSPRNNFVARELQKKNIGTFLFDLLTSEEDEVYETRFNIDLLTERLIFVTKYIAQKKEYSKLHIGYFGASTGAASAMKAAAELPDLVHAIVSRGGRLDLAMNVVDKITVPVLLIVGELDRDVFALNQQFYKNLKSEKKLEIVKGATHLFEEKGTLQEAAVLATDWFVDHLKAPVKS